MNQEILKMKKIVIFLSILSFAFLYKFNTAYGAAKTYDDVTNIVEDYLELVGDNSYWNSNIRTNGTEILISQVEKGDFLSCITHKGCKIKKGEPHLNAYGCTSNCFTGVSNGIAQCMGFADYIEYIIFRTTESTDFTKLYCVDNNFRVNPGDSIRFYIPEKECFHSIVVYKVEGNNVYIIEANWPTKCHINTRVLSMDTIRDYINRENSYILVSPAKPATRRKITLSNRGADISGSTVIYESQNHGFFKSKVSEKNIVSIKRPKKEGYIFTGYYTEKNQKGFRCINEKGKIIVPNYFFAKNTKLYAGYVKCSTLSINTESIPKIVYLGNVPKIKSTISSNYKIKEIKIQIYNSEGKKVLPNTYAYPDVKKFKLHKSDLLSNMAFRKLKTADTYTIKIKATDELNKTILTSFDIKYEL